MELWAGNLKSFIADSSSGELVSRIHTSFARYHGFEPANTEVKSWERSLSKLARSISPLASKDIGIVCEYHLQFSQRRIDAVLLGRGDGSRDRAAVVELKQWLGAKLQDAQSLNVIVGNEEVLHPFVWNMSLRNAPFKGIDLLLVDEAHRLRKTSNIRFTRRAERNRRSQFEELVNALIRQIGILTAWSGKPQKGDLGPLDPGEWGPVIEINAQERQVFQSLVLADPGAECLDVVGVGKV